MEIRYFCTYFDKNYLFRGLALYRSMEKHCSNFLLYILCMDNETYATLKELNLSKVKLIELKDFEDAELLAVKSGRTPVEYCWTCTPSLPLYLLKKYGHDMVTYIDADLMFFYSPEKIFEEFGSNSILVIEHRFGNNKEEKEKDNGKYNVQFLTFKNNKNGLACLKWWRERCLEWCYNRHENGLIGDQTYLNEWDKLFKGVYSLKNKGGGLAPWNINNYKLTKNSNDVFVEKDKLIFYHFHAFHIYSKFFFDYSFGYKFTALQKEFIYFPYVNSIKDAIAEVRNIDRKFKYGFHDGIGMHLVNKIAQRIIK